MSNDCLICTCLSLLYVMYRCPDISSSLSFQLMSAILADLIYYNVINVFKTLIDCVSCLRASAHTHTHTHTHTHLRTHMYYCISSLRVVPHTHMYYCISCLRVVPHTHTYVLLYKLSKSCTTHICIIV